MFKYLNFFLDCLFPPLCYSCFQHLQKNEKQLSVCAKCASSIKICPITFKTKLGFRLISCSSFDIPAVRELIHTFKYRKIEQAIHPITELLIKPCVQKVLLRNSYSVLRTPFIIIPIPLHKSKEKKRGFNQSELIARALAKYLLDVRPPTEAEHLRVGSASILRLLVRVKNTDSQTEQKSKETRLANVQNCFQLIENCKLKIENSSTIVLVDDVTTSGATLAEAARVLRQAGAKRVIAFTLAKA